MDARGDAHDIRGDGESLGTQTEDRHAPSGPGGRTDLDALLEDTREKISRDPGASFGDAGAGGSDGKSAAMAAISALAPHAAEVPPTQAVDLLERAATFGPREVVDAVWDAFDGDFAYTGWALALALRCAHEDIARDLLARGVDLLGEARRPRKVRALLPHEGTFTRFDLTRESPTLFLNNMDHTVSTEVFEPFTGVEQLAGRPYARPTDVAAACACVLGIARDGLFDDTVFDDLFRAAMVRAWHALRHPTERDPDLADTCLDLGKRMLALHRERGMGDGNVELVLGNLVVPRADRAIVAFVCQNAPRVFLGRLLALDWLREDVDLVQAMVPHLSPGTAEQNAELLRILAENGLVAELERVATWPHALDPSSVEPAIQAASAAGHAEAAAWLLAQSQGVTTHSKAAPSALRPVAPVPSRSHATSPSGAQSPQTLRSDTNGLPNPADSVHDRRLCRQVPADQGKQVPADQGDGVPAERESLAAQVIDLARGLVVEQNPFLASSIARLTFESTDQRATAQFSTNGRVLRYDVARTLDAFRSTRKAPSHDLMHVLVHCIMLHPFVGHRIDRRAWDLASDVVAEALTTDVMGPREGPRAHEEAVALEQMEGTLGGRLTTERLYHALRAGSFQNALDVWEPLFRVDDHDGWYPSPDEKGAPSAAGTGPNEADEPGGAAGSDGGAGASAGASAAGQQSVDPSRTQAQSGNAPASPEGADAHPCAGADFRDGLSGPLEDQTSQDADGGGMPQGPKSDLIGPKRASEGPNSSFTGPSAASAASGPSTPTPKTSAPRLSPTERERGREAWRREAKRIRVDLETLSRRRGSKLGRFVEELEVSGHERVDYREFLRQFAVQGEEMRLSDDEFDYVFYTYGLELYGDMPLIEPLEYREEHRIRDFVIVIDTSSSVTHDVVQQFVDTTFDVLTSESSFFQKVNIHIVQADQRVQSDTKITSLAELDRWRRHIKLRGFGGTDFRPAFRYVDELLAAGEFDDLSGLVYFTDGWGIYPERMPPYKTTFVFYDEDHRPELVPAWAMQITLHPGEFESMSVY